MRNPDVKRVSDDLPLILGLLREHGELDRYQLADLIWGPARGVERYNRGDRAYRRLQEGQRRGLVREKRPGNMWEAVR